MKKRLSSKRRVQEQKLEVDIVEMDEVAVMTGILLANMKSMDELVNMMKLKKSEDVLLLSALFLAKPLAVTNTLWEMI